MNKKFNNDYNSDHWMEYCEQYSSIIIFLLGTDSTQLKSFEIPIYNLIGQYVENVQKQLIIAGYKVLKINDLNLLLRELNHDLSKGNEKLQYLFKNIIDKKIDINGTTFIPDLLLTITSFLKATQFIVDNFNDVYKEFGYRYPKISISGQKKIIIPDLNTCKEELISKLEQIDCLHLALSLINEYQIINT